MWICECERRENARTLPAGTSMDEGTRSMLAAAGCADLLPKCEQQGFCCHPLLNDGSQSQVGRWLTIVLRHCWTRQKVWMQRRTSMGLIEANQYMVEKSPWMRRTGWLREFEGK